MRKMDQNDPRTSPMDMELPASNFSAIGTKNGIQKSLIGNAKSTVGVKKLVIKNAKASTLPENFYGSTWGKLRDAIDAVHESRATSSNLEDLYSFVENICTHKMSARLYEDLKVVCQARIASLASALSRNQSEQLDFLLEMSGCWEQFCRQMIMIRSIFLVIDRTYTLQTPGVLSIWDVGLELFRVNVLDIDVVRTRTVSGILMLLEKERGGEIVDSSLIKSLLRMLSDLQIYTAVFEQKFLAATEQLYKYEGEQLINSMEIPSYLRRAGRRLQEEEERANKYLDHSTKKPLIRSVEKQLLEAHVDEILSKGLPVLLNESRKTDLSLLFELLQRAKALNQLRAAFVDYISQTGMTIVMNPENDDQMVPDLLTFKEKVDTISKDCFAGQEMYTTGIREAFEQFINKRPNKPAEMIAKFVDSRLKSGNKESSEEEMEKVMDKVMVIFRFIHGKDVFEAFYKKDLAKRLLVGRSASVDAEKSMLSKLKQECGAQFTSKLEGMFKDVELSRDIMAAFKVHLEQRELPGNIEMAINVLTMGFWPSYPAIEVNLPPEMEQYLECFKQFYLSKHSGRHLKWQSTLGHCILKAKFKSGAKELQVSLFQALVILMFNSGESYTCQQIKDHTNIEMSELTRTLQSLSVGKKDSRILKKNRMDKAILPTDEFTINDQFENKHYRIKINQIQLKETVQEQETTQEQVFQDRQYQVDAAIVRIMKTRKTLLHNDLVRELMQQLKFPVKASDLKKRIESLIEREYMKRDGEKHNTYVYLA